MNRRGLALLLALLGILVAAMLATAALTAARLRWRTGRGLVAATQASAAVSASLSSRLAGWDQGAAESLVVGLSVPSLLPILPVPSVLSYDSVLRLGPALYQLRTVAERVAADSGVLARDGAVELVALTAPRLVDSSAVVAPVAPLVSGTGIVDGADLIPAGWDTLCAPPEAPTPPFVVESAPFGRLSPVTVAELERWAEIRVAGSVPPPGPLTDAAGICFAAATNWGDPQGEPCRDRLPLVVLQSGSVVADGKGQGILIATGDLSLSGNFYFAGAILALGDVQISGQAQVMGLILAGGAVRLTDQARVSRSTCAVRRALSVQRRIADRVAGGWWRVP
jgi:hypothetical protein